MLDNDISDGDILDDGTRDLCKSNVKFCIIRLIHIN